MPGAVQMDIVNSALHRIGAKKLTALTDNTESARVMTVEWPLARDRLLRRYRWSFAMNRVQLAADASAPDWGFSYRYQLPADFIRLDLVNDIFVGLDMSDYRNSDMGEYSLEGRYLLTDIGAPLKIRYIKQVTDVGLYDASFSPTLALQLALDACERITQSTTKKESIRADLREAVVEAVRAGAIEKPPQPIPDDSWIFGRLG